MTRDRKRIKEMTEQKRRMEMMTQYSLDLPGDASKQQQQLQQQQHYPQQQFLLQHTPQQHLAFLDLTQTSQMLPCDDVCPCHKPKS